MRRRRAPSLGEPPRSYSAHVPQACPDGLSPKARELLVSSVMIGVRGYTCRTCGARGELVSPVYIGRDGLALHPPPLCSDPFPEERDPEELAYFQEHGISQPRIIR